jgi:3-oxoacyl-[acyl-carrier protein] reductase
MRETGLKNKVVIVTGAATGIGRATAHRFAEEGARVAGWDVKEDAAAEFVREIGAAGGEALFQRVDVTDAKSIHDGVQQVVNRWGAINVLVNNAGILRDAQLVRYKDGAVAGMMSDEAFDAVIDVNLRGVFLCTRAVVPQMFEAGGGVILNASSVVGLYGNFGQTNYTATKAGVIATEMMTAMPEKILQSMRDHTPIGRLGEPDDIAETYVWLASDRASFVSGAVISVDGGIVIGT